MNTPIKQAIRTTKKYYALLESMGIETVQDLLEYYPREYEDSSVVKTLKEIEGDDVQVIKGQIFMLVSFNIGKGKTMQKSYFKDTTGEIANLSWFNQPHLLQMIRSNTDVLIKGKASLVKGRYNFSNPKFEYVKDSQLHIGGITAVYREKASITSKWLRDKMEVIFKNFPHQEIEESDTLPTGIRDREGLMPLSMAMKEIHQPRNSRYLQGAKDRLGFNEMLEINMKSLQKKKAFKADNQGKCKGYAVDIERMKRFFKYLPFVLTESQKLALFEICKDLELSTPMQRLLEGDVGSGKTVVALGAALQVADAGGQVMLLAPTEILAQQHYKSIQKLAPNLRLELLTGSTKTSEREDILSLMRSGAAQMVIGTHALLQDDIEFKELGFAIIDEQHRFGVEQRRRVSEMGNPHVLNMTATPIPRTLAVIAYGDQELSVITARPEGRKPIQTVVVDKDGEREYAYHRVEEEVKAGRQVFVICPLVNESDAEMMYGIKSVSEEYHKLKAIFPQCRIREVHGKLKPQFKEETMQEFKEGKSDILVATSVIEVGIDIPNATVILIEGAERFGLAQLHQFRGRVGRGEHQSYCFLFPSKPGDNKRLKAMEKFDDGFKLAEIDLEIRGPGEIYGLKQSGVPELKMASLNDAELIKKTQLIAEEIINS